MQPAKDTPCSGSGEPSLRAFLNHANGPILTFFLRNTLHIIEMFICLGFFARAQMRQLKPTFRNSTEDNNLLSKDASALLLSKDVQRKQEVLEDL